MTLPDIMAALDALDLLGLASVQAKVGSRLIEIAASKRVAAPVEDQLLTAAEAAGYLQRRPSWLYRHPGLPFRVKSGNGRALYSLNGIREWARKNSPR